MFDYRSLRVMTLGAAVLLVGGATGIWAAQEPPKGERPAANTDEATTSAPRPVAAEQQATDQPTSTDGGKTSVPAESSQEGETLEDKAARGRRLRAAEKTVVAKWDKLHSFSAMFVQKLRREMFDPDNPTGPPIEGLDEENTGTYACVMEDGKMRVRMDLRGGGKTKPSGGDAMTIPFKSTRIYDGEYLHFLVETGGRVTASKQEPPNPQLIAMGGPDLLDYIHSHFETKLLPDERIGGRDMFVFEATAKGGAVRDIRWFDKKSGIVTKILMYNAQGKVSRSITLSDIKLNPKFPKDHFVFSAPEGVEVKKALRVKGP